MECGKSTVPLFLRDIIHYKFILNYLQYVREPQVIILWLPFYHHGSCGDQIIAMAEMYLAIEEAFFMAFHGLRPIYVSAYSQKGFILDITCI